MSCHGSTPSPAAGRSSRLRLGRGRGGALAPSSTATLAGAPSGAIPASRPDASRVLLVGAPNVGKSTLFNALTGARQRTMNAPGTTVELFTGTWRTARDGGSGPAVERAIVDLPGTYSLLARSVDEQVTADAVREMAQPAAAGSGPRGAVVVVLDATALTRSLYLLAQVAETGAPLVVALTMLDLAAATTDSPTSSVDPGTLAANLAATLGVPVVPVDARNRGDAGLRQLARRVDEVAARPRRVTGIADVVGPACSCGEAPTAGADGLDLTEELAHAETLFAWVERALDDVTSRLAALAPAGAATARVHTASNTTASSTTASNTTASNTTASNTTASNTTADDVAGRSSARSAAAAPRRPGPPPTFSDRVDSVLLNPWAGIPVFLAVVWLLFELTTKFAAPLQGAIDALISGPVAGGLTALLWLVGQDDTWVRGLLVDGLLAGVGTVLTFMPVMAIMFAALGVLEDSGYLARAAFVADRAMRSLGLDGRALLPLIIGFGCNLPALAATRTLPSARQRLLTGLLIPLTSCAARLTVYILLAGAFFPDHAGTVIFGMYLTSVLMVLGGGLVLRRTAFRDVHTEPLILVLPPYQRPGLRTLGASVYLRVGAFVVRAGKIIVATLLVVWMLMAIPATSGYAVGDVPVGESLYGRVASAIAPTLAPAGFGNDHAAAALVTGFVAKEVVVGSFAQSYSVTEPGDPAQAGDLGERLRASFDESSGGHGGAAALAFMVFVLAYTPCVAALAEQKRLFGWRPTLWALATQLAVAWVLAVAVFQVGSRL